jgi:crotonobetainyl-CoA:carnitine CoA-transferase CaiB-like acyl-CoA transferase
MRNRRGTECGEGAAKTIGGVSMGIPGLNGSDAASGQLSQLWRGLHGVQGIEKDVTFTGVGSTPSRYPVTAFASASIAAAGVAVAELLQDAGFARPAVSVDRVLSTAWFGRVNLPIGDWQHAEGSGLTGEYPTADGRWLRMQMNYLQHSVPVVRALGCEPERSAVAARIAQLTAQEAEDLLTAAGGAVAMARTVDEWAAHPQAAAIADAPLVERIVDTGERERSWRPLVDRPLAGIRVLDMTRVLAGPMATRFLASYGAEVLRIDPPGYDEPRGSVLVTLGKRCTHVDATTAEGRAILLGLLRDCDVFVHGYRDGVLERLGLGLEERRKARPGLIEATLTAYGWNGPWHDRRGFDTLVEMASGMAVENQRWAGTDAPQLLPVQALDHGTGHLLAAAAIRGLTHRLDTGQGSRWRCSLIGTAAHLMGSTADADDATTPVDDTPWDTLPVATPRGPAYRLRPAVGVFGAPQYWDRPGEPFGASTPVWAREDLPVH